MYSQDATGLEAFSSPYFFVLSLLSPTPSPATNKKPNNKLKKKGSMPALSSIIRSVPAMHRTLAVHIYISIQRGLAVFAGTSRKKSFPGCSVLDRLCAERRLGIMQKSCKHGGSPSGRRRLRRDDQFTT